MVDICDYISSNYDYDRGFIPKHTKLGASMHHNIHVYAIQLSFERKKQNINACNSCDV